jgi:hypothetical protein
MSLKAATIIMFLRQLSHFLPSSNRYHVINSELVFIEIYSCHRGKYSSMDEQLQPRGNDVRDTVLAEDADDGLLLDIVDKNSLSPWR